MNDLDGSYLHCEKRIADAGPQDTIWFDDSRKDVVQAYLKSLAAKPYLDALETTSRVIDGYESPFGIELLATVDWLIKRAGCAPTLGGIRQGLAQWPTGESSAARKQRIFDDRAIISALDRLAPVSFEAQVF